MTGLKLGISGAGFIARFQAVAMRQVRGIEFAGVTQHRRSHEVVKLAKDLGLGEPRIYKSVGEMAKNVDCLAIYSPNFSRISVMEEIVAAVKGGAKLKGVICEKPLGRTVAEARRLVELAQSANLRTAYFENQIFMKPLRAQLTQLEIVQKKMGPMSLARSAEEHGGPHEPWFWDPTRQGGGVLSDMGCHSIAAAWYTLTPIGKPLTFLQPQSVSAEVGLLKWGQPFWREKLLLERGVDYSRHPAEDFATGIITYRNPETGQKVKAQFTNSSETPPRKPSKTPSRPWRRPPQRAACWPCSTTRPICTDTRTRMKTRCRPLARVRTAFFPGAMAWRLPVS